ncbi:hypothetical protein AB8A28_19725 [Tardiphaga sp. 71_E8_N1_1]|uniref:hypothetical protein n=1 Tax=Tardiphaga sp. 71_E8_N1_1 TaxID=3240784 RepID=UPI003F8CCF45
MARQNGITQNAQLSNDQDIAVAALRRVQLAGEDDAAYESAIAALEIAPATTAAGVQALFDLLHPRLDSALDGDEIDPEMMRTLARNISAGLAHLVRKAG